MEILSVFKAILTPEKDQTADSFAFLKPGDKLIGRVLRLEADGRALIDLGGVRALAQTTVPVEVGQRLPLKVVQTGQPLHLRLDETATVKPQPPLPQIALTNLFSPDDQQRITQTIDRLLFRTGDATPGGTALNEALPQGSASQSTVPAQSAEGSEAGSLSRAALTEPVRQALIQLKTVFEPLAMDAPIARQGEWVQSAVENRGVLFEVRLAQALEKADSSTMPSPAAGAARAMPDSSGGPEPKTVIDPEPAPAGPPVKTGSDGTAVPPPREGAGVIVPSESDPGPDIPFTKVQDTRPGKGESIPSDATTDDGQPAMEATAMEKALRILVQDLKPQLLVLRSHLGSPDGQSTETVDPVEKEAAFLRQVVDRMLGHVEQQQQQAVRRSGESEAYQVFTHLLPVKDQSMPVRLKVYYPNKGGPARDDPQHRVALLLDMDQLGPVRADLTMVERQLRLHFFVRDESVQDLFAQHIQDVAQALEGIFQQVSIDTQVSRDKIDRFEGEDLQGPPLGRIDVKA